MPELASPLPTRTPLRRAPLPRWEPPYDDELAGDPADRRGSAPTGRARSVQLPLDVPTARTPSDLEPARALRLAPEPAGGGPGSGGRVEPRARPAGRGHGDDDLPRTPRAELPDPRPWAGRLVQVLVEVLAAERPASQVMRHVSLPVYTDLVAAPRRSVRPGARPAAAPQVTSVRVTEPDDGVAEVCAVVRRHGRYRAVALRLEGLGGRWRCTALQVG